MCTVQEGFFENDVTLKWEKDDKNMKREFMSLSQNMKKEYGNFAFSHDIILKQILLAFR